MVELAVGVPDFCFSSGILTLPLKRKEKSCTFQLLPAKGPYLFCGGGGKWG